MLITLKLITLTLWRAGSAPRGKRMLEGQEAYVRHCPVCGQPQIHSAAWGRRVKTFWKKRKVNCLSRRWQWQRRQGFACHA